MTNIGRVEPLANEWDDFVAAHPHGHILQTSPWGELKSAFGWETELVALADDEETGALVDEWCWDAHTDAPQLLCGAQLLYRRLPGGLGQIAYVPFGPLVNWTKHCQLTALLEQMTQAARARGAIAITLEPGLPDEPQYRRLLSEAGLVPSPLGSVQPRRTLIVDISPGEDEILAAMRSKTRYNIRLAARKGVQVREGALADLPAFYRLTEATAARDRFGVHELAYYEQALRLFAPRGQARLLLAEVEGEPVAALMVFALGRQVWYFYGASGNAHRNKMPNYLLQWEAIRWAKSQGCTEYDLWGVPDAEREQLEAEFTTRRDGLWGVYRFKRGFGGRLVRFVGAWDLVLRPPRYRVYTWAARLRHKMSGL